MHRLVGLGQDHDWDSIQILAMHRGISPALDSGDSGYDSDEEVLRLLLPQYQKLNPSSPDKTNAGVTVDPPPPPISRPWRRPPTPRRLRVVKYAGATFCHDHLPVFNGQMIKSFRGCSCKVSQRVARMMIPSNDASTAMVDLYQPAHHPLPNAFCTYPAHTDLWQLQPRGQYHPGGVMSDNLTDALSASCQPVTEVNNCQTPAPAFPPGPEAKVTSEQTGPTGNIFTRPILSAIDEYPDINFAIFFNAKVSSLPSLLAQPCGSGKDDCTLLSWRKPVGGEYQDGSDGLLFQSYRPTNVLTDEDLAWYTALLTPVPPEPLVSTSTPMLADDSGSASHLPSITGSSSGGLRSTSSDVEEEEQEQEEDMVMSDDD